jgi:putative SOS response-associated peptidase YedK
MVAEMLGVDLDSIPDYYRPRYNIAPTDHHFIVTMECENRKAASAKWGLINREEKDRSLAARRINARAETVDVAPSFGEAYRQRRCVVPADGFYEWSGPKNKRMPQ